MPTPTTRALESAIASLEGTEDAVAFASGMGAVYAAMLLDVRAGQRIVAAPDVYGATYAILNRLLPSLGIETIFVDLLDLDALEQALCSTRPALVYAETISNPLLRVADLRRSRRWRIGTTRGSRSTTRSRRPGWSIPRRSASIRSSTRPPSIWAVMAMSPAVSLRPRPSVPRSCARSTS